MADEGFARTHDGVRGGGRAATVPPGDDQRGRQRGGEGAVGEDDRRPARVCSLHVLSPLPALGGHGDDARHQVLAVRAHGEGEELLPARQLEGRHLTDGAATVEPAHNAFGVGVERGTGPDANRRLKDAVAVGHMRRGWRGEGGLGDHEAVRVDDPHGHRIRRATCRRAADDDVHRLAHRRDRARRGRHAGRRNRSGRVVARDAEEDQRADGGGPPQALTTASFFMSAQFGPTFASTSMPVSSSYAPVIIRGTVSANRSTSPSGTSKSSSSCTCSSIRPSM